MDKNQPKTSTREGKITRQKRRSTKSALKNGGAENFDGARVLRPYSAVALFIRQLTGKKQARAGLSFGFGSHADTSARRLRNSC